MTEALRKDNATRDARGIEAILELDRRKRPWFLRWRTLAWLIAVLAAGAGGAYALWALGASGPATTYVTEPVTRGNLTVVVTATGSAQPINQVNISSELSGTVRRVLVDYNSPVKVGQTLAELDTDKLKATIEGVRSLLNDTATTETNTAATITEKRSDFERYAALSSRGVASTKDLDVAKAAYDRAIAAHASALAEVTVNEAELRLNDINLSKARLVSPIDGMVLKRAVDPGMTVASSLQAPVLFVIAEDLRRMELQIDIDEADVGKVRVGQRATFGVDAYPDKRFPAVIRDIRFGSETVQGVVTYKAVLNVDNSELMIRPGMTATVEIVVQSMTDALTVPSAALRFTPASAQPSRPEPGFLERLMPRQRMSIFRPPPRREETGPNRTVWVMRDGAPAAVKVVIGPTGGRRTAIAGGELAADQPVIVDAIVPKTR